MSNIIKEWNNRTIRVREDRYVSLTDMAQASGKLFADWRRTKSTESYLETLSSIMGIPIMGLIESKIGGSPENTGTWGHPKVAIRFAQWCSDKFAVQVDMWIDELMTTGQVSLIQKPYQILGAYQERVKEMFDQLPLIPKGYWCVLHESANILIWVETQLKCPVDKSDLLDGSIGKSWSNYRSDKSWALDRIKFPYTFPCGKKVEPWCYRMSELGYFRSFLQDDYCPNGLLAYLNRKYPGIVKV